VPPAYPRRGKRERGRIKFLAAAGGCFHAARFFFAAGCNAFPWASNRPTVCGPQRIDTFPSRCSWMVTVMPASVFRKRLLFSCQLRSPIATVLSLATTRSLCTVKIQSRSVPPVRRNAVPFCAAATVKFVLNSRCSAPAETRWPLPRSRCRPAATPAAASRARSRSCVRSARGLRRIGRDHLHPQFLQRPAHLRRTMLIDFLAGLRRIEKVTATVAVKRAEQTPRCDHRAQPSHHRARRFLLHQLRVVDLAGGVVQNHDQVVPALLSQRAALKRASPSWWRWR